MSVSRLMGLNPDQLTLREVGEHASLVSTPLNYENRYVKASSAPGNSKETWFKGNQAPAQPKGKQGRTGKQDAQMPQGFLSELRPQARRRAPCSTCLGRGSVRPSPGCRCRWLPPGERALLPAPCPWEGRPVWGTAAGIPSLQTHR
uniref:Uncharacterized protein n=1 Tax=Molossus molossus TaxID=27622 RepID=A0A7J8DCB2_MOLMO|nr:hypothetical protein HJG59_009318 [Molossus molossus]